MRAGNNYDDIGVSDDRGPDNDDRSVDIYNEHQQHVYDILVEHFKYDDPA